MPTYYNLESPSTSGDKITLTMPLLLEHIQNDIKSFKEDEPWEFNVSTIEMTEAEFDALPEFQY